MARGAMVDVKAVNRELRASLWPALREHGFEARTDRAAWRYWEGGVEVVEVPSVGAGADAVGCTTFSFSAIIGSNPGFLTGSAPVIDERPPRPRRWDCRLTGRLHKGIEQPWFRPFDRPLDPAAPESVRSHREGLQAVIRQDVHDRPEIWYVREDGSNLAEMVVDLRASFERRGVRMLERFRDPCAVIAMVGTGELPFGPYSPAARETIAAARRFCPP
jgi:hypothetical protein